MAEETPAHSSPRRHLVLLILLVGLGVAQIIAAVYQAHRMAPPSLLPAHASPSGSPSTATARSSPGPSTVLIRLPATQQEWTASAGAVVLLLENGEKDKAGIRLEGQAAEIAPVSPGGTGRVSAQLGPGTYTLTVTRSASTPTPLRLVIQ